MSRLPLRNCLAPAALLVLAAALGSGLQSRPVVLDSALVGQATLSSVLECSGAIRPGEGAIVRVGTRMGGNLTAVTVGVGDAVKKGQLLAQVDDRELAARVDAARAHLEAALAEAERAKSAAPAAIAEARAALAGSQAQSDLDAARLNRIRTLFAEGNASKDLFEMAERNRKTADAKTRSDAAAVAVTAGTWAGAAAKARDDVRAALAELEAARTLRGECRIESPIDGVVAAVLTHAGETVVAQLATVDIVTLLDPSRLELTLDVYEKNVAGVAPGAPVRFTVPGCPDTAFTGRVDRVEPAPQIKDGAVVYTAVTVLSPETGTRLRPGMTARCVVTLPPRTGVPVVPTAALRRENDRTVVYVVAPDGALSRRTLTLGSSSGEMTEVTAGLAPGERVALSLAGL